jgi:O-methyltransferase
MPLEELFDIIEKADRLCLDRPRARRLCAAAKEALALDGEFWECGVYKGGSARMLAEVLKEKPRPLRLFDTFRGFVDVAPEDGGGHSNGAMDYGDVEAIKEFLGVGFVSFHPGAIPASFAGLEGSRIAFLNLDVDLYRPTKEALRFVLPRMVEGGIIIIDDCGTPGFPGVWKAVSEEVRGIPISIIRFPEPAWGYQGKVVKDSYYPFLS